MSELVRFDHFMDWALYDPEQGFYGQGRGAGRRGGDFITSPETGPLFGTLLARYLDRVWDELGRPDPYIVAEAAAGTGTLARAILGAEPACRNALRYQLVEVAAPARAEHQRLVEHHPATVASATEWPERCHIGLANELLDNLPVRVIDTSDVPAELYARREDAGWAPRWEPVTDKLPTTVTASAGVVPWAQAAQQWVERAVTTSQHLVVFDYGANTAELAMRGVEGWLRCYRDHHRVADPFVAPGFTDITADVPLDQLPDPTAIARQADWLAALGIHELADASAQQWRQQAHIGGLSALRARSTVHEADALTDPDGLGAFWVLTWDGAS